MAPGRIAAGLTGGRLVEAPNHNGFRVPLITEAVLRDGGRRGSRVARAIGKDRLAAFWRLEPAVLGDRASELEAFRDLYRSGAAAKLVAALDK